MTLRLTIIALLLTTLTAGAWTQQQLMRNAYGVRGAAVSVWTPSSLNPILWLDALVNVSVTTSNTVTTWGDRSSTTASVYQATAGYRPSFATNTQIGKAGVLFDDVDDQMEITNLTSSATNFSVFAAICGFGTNAISRAILDVQTGRLLIVYNSGGVGPGYVDSVNNTSVAPVNTNSQVLTYMLNSSGSSIYVDGVQGTTNTPYVKAALGGVIMLGNRYASNTYPMNGYLHEFLVFKGALSSTNRQLVEAYLKNKWGTP